MQTNTIHIALTGHRPNKLGGYDLTKPGYADLQADLEQYIRFQLQSHDVVWGHSGLALGADTIWTKAILAMKKEFPGRVFFHAEIPMNQQPTAWFKKTDIDFWHESVANADEKSVYGDLDAVEESFRKKFASKFLNERNEGMVNHANILLAVWDGSSGGTGNAVNYAKKQGATIVLVKPDKYF